MSNVVELIAVGTELLLGNIVNLDAQILSQELSALGLNVYYHTVVGDNPQRLREVVDIAKKRADIIITTGGLGPTCDDLTKNILAESFGKQLIEDKDTLDRIHAYFLKINALHRMTPNNAQQALLPEGCTIFTNDWGTAPGCGFFAENTHVLMLPGPPSECKAMFLHRAVPYLASISEGVIASHTLKFFGMGEAELESHLRERMNAMTNPSLAPYAKQGECELRVTAKAASQAEAEKLLAPEVAFLQEKFGDVIYGVDVDSVEEVVLQLLREQGKTLAFAESCTGGYLGKRITDLAGASQVFLGSLVTYSNQAKEKILEIPHEMLEEEGAVSEKVARAMAVAVRTKLGADIGVSITGIAGPDTDEKNTPIGTVFLGLSTEEKEEVLSLSLGKSRERLRLSGGHHAFHMIRRYLIGK
ncbi:MAG: competence/damage-inducible protein A [Eubacteriales bacterium]